MKMYEGLLMVEPAIASRDWQKVVDEVDRIAKRNGATVIQIHKWGERKLSYPVKRNNRGAYVLTYLSADPTALGKIKADLQLSEVVLRSLLLSHEGEMRKEAPREFETAGPLPPKIRGPGGPRSFGPPSGDRGPRR